MPVVQIVAVATKKGNEIEIFPNWEEAIVYIEELKKKKIKYTIKEEIFELSMFY